MGWLQYLLAILLFNALGGLALFALLMLQGVLPFNPQHLPGLSWDLALNTAISFVSNTNWQAYAGESTMSYLSQMVGLTVQNFLSAATGIAVVFALTRAFARQKNVDPRQCLGRSDAHYPVAAAAALSAGGPVLYSAGRAAESAGLPALYHPRRGAPAAADGACRLTGSD
ncbi:Potassium-transporting ATPase A chain (TC 3.A.3.7.1) [Klebsiella pneumoniae IS43]|uniref:Potassium-transporting ATPase A chain (TC 3.A.3.7.1) n=1 Tax=Klebsiella pneumoniae IS43 TaxID=1432552 RepID=W1DQG2_KLEPN|nr:Potassium-transporting ATPase A chain (TC 3.A.3.7.1) [Klebsiella pneumoniae IS43]